MKAILIIDMPKTCGHCDCADREYGTCNALHDIRECDWQGRPEWCPLKPLPELRRKEKYAYTYELTYDQGYNRAIKEITGEADKADAENQWWAEHSSRFD